MSNPQHIYKIKHRKSGLWLTGTGQRVRWTRLGRTWNSYSHLMNFIHNVKYDLYGGDVHNWIIHKFSVDPESVTISTVGERKVSISNLQAIHHTYGWYTREMYERLMRDGLLDQFPYMLISDPSMRAPEVRQIINQFKPRFGWGRKDFRHNSKCVAFSSRDKAMQAKMTFDIFPTSVYLPDITNRDQS
jgi:hypothetical protein